MNVYSDQWAIILGGSSGLGLATAHKLASTGLNIAIVHRDRKMDLEKLNDEVRIMESNGIVVKTYNKNALEQEVRSSILEEFKPGSVYMLVHSIAKGSLKSMTGDQNTSLSKPDLDITLHAMATSWYEWANSIRQKRLFSDNARNIAFTSEGSSRVWPGYGAVSVAKASLEALMRNMAVEWAPEGIRSNCIQAGTTKTASFSIIPYSEKLAELAIERNPFKRMTTPQDVADAVYLLSRKEAQWINGTILRVDGGEGLR